MLQGLEDRSVPATITVTNNLDTLAVDGKVSIREAIESINGGANINADVVAVGAYGTTDTVLFQAGLTGPISLAAGQLNISSRMTITGPGSSLLTIQNAAAAGPASRVFNITDGPTTISGLKITGGNATTSGGGISIFAVTTLNAVDVSANLTSAISYVDLGGGGGISIHGGSLTLVDSVVSNNSAIGVPAFAGGFVQSYGGGILNVQSFSLTVTNSTIANNSASGSGGGICLALRGTLNMTGSTVSGNKSNTLYASPYGGGGIFLRNSTATIRNSTISGNSTNSAGKDSTGGGIVSSLGPAPIRIENTTIAFNDAGVSSGGGIKRSGSAVISIVSSIISNNTASGSGPDVSGTISLADHSLLGDATGSVISTDIGPTIVADPLLDVLANYGGSTATHNLKAGSPAINVGLSTVPTLAFDQRGSGFPRVQGAGIDIGSSETSDQGPSAVATAANVTVAGGTTHLVTVVYSDTNGSKLIDASTLATGNITVSGPGFFATPTLIGGPYANGQSVTVTYQFTAADNAILGQWDSSDDGIYSIDIVAGKVFDKDAPTPFAVPAFTAGTFTVAAPITYTVDEVSDVDNGIGKLSIREAIVSANNDGVPSVVLFDQTEFSGTKTITMTAGELMITEGVTITGPNGGLILDGAAASRIFNINPNTTNDAVSISNMTATNGMVSGSAGGGILNVDSALTLTKVTVSNCNTNNNGGGIGMTTNDGSLNLIDSMVINNKAVASGKIGGGINAQGQTNVTVLRSTIAGNQAGRNGGGVNMQSSGTLTIDDSEITGNSSTQFFTSPSGPGGGGICQRGGDAVIRNSTISGNFTGFQGGGIFVTFSVTTIINSTIAYNTALTQGGGIGQGINDRSVVHLESTIVANNSATYYEGPDTNTKLSASYSLIGNTTDTVITGGHNLLNVDAGLTPLDYYGGAQRVHGLRPGSVALNVGNNVTSLANDQRGAGFPRLVGPGVDIGAFEGIVTSPTGVLTQLGPIVVAGAMPNTVEVTYCDDVGIDAGKIDTGDIQILNPASVALPITGAAFTPMGTGGKAVYTFTVPGGNWDVTANGRYTVNLLPAQVQDIDAPPQTALAANLGSFDVAVPITYVVDEVSDAVDGKTGAGQLSIREALNSANTDANPSAIVFDPVIFSGTKTIAVTSGHLDITGGITITGPQGGVVLDAQGKNRLFLISSSTLSAAVSMINMTLTNGHAPFHGGGIQNSGARLTLTNVNINNCIADGGGGGGGIDVDNDRNSLTLIDSNVSNNKTIANRQGGGIRFGGTGQHLTLLRTTVSGNQADSGGGGIWFSNSCYLTVDASTISGNTSNIAGGTYPDGSGGGLFLFPTKGTIRNSTISGNTALGATSDGGGIFLYSNVNTLSIINSTITANSAGGKGGGISATKGPGTDDAARVLLSGTIVSNNTASVSFNDINGPATADYTLIGDTAGSLITGSNNQLNVNPLLAPLANNGGPTKTHAITSASPAYNTGSNTASLAFDQRGNTRSVGQTDIGAFEVQPAAKITSVAINGGDQQRSMVTKIQVNFNQHIGFTAGAAVAFSLTRVGDGNSVNLGASVDDSGGGTVVTLTFTGGAVDGNSLADGRYALHALAAGFNAEGLDGDGNGTGGDDFIFDEPNSPAPLDLSKVFRLFGDGEGNGSVNSGDFAMFRTVFGVAGPVFDFDNNGVVNSNDFAEFRKRFGLMI